MRKRNLEQYPNNRGVVFDYICGFDEYGLPDDRKTDPAPTTEKKEGDLTIPSAYPYIVESTMDEEDDKIEYGNYSYNIGRAIEVLASTNAKNRGKKYVAMDLELVIELLDKEIARLGG